MMQLIVTLVVMLVLMTSASARSPRIDDENERIIPDNGRKIWKDARQDFKSLIEPTGAKGNFRGAVDKLISFINSNTTESGCNTLCIEKLDSLLEKDVPEEGPVCKPLCRAAMYKLEKIAG